MLTIDNGHRRLTRRDLLSVGGLGLAGLSLESLLAAKAAGASKRVNPVTGKSVIFLFQQGGPSQLETFDPKPDAPAAVRTVTETVATSIPGVHFGEAMSKIAKHADKCTIVRSFQTRNAGHNIQPIVGPDSLNTSIGVHYARVAGSTRQDSGFPTNMVLHPDAVRSDVRKGEARGNLSETGSYGKTFAPFIPGGKDKLQHDMTLSMNRDRFTSRRHLLQSLDQLNLDADANGEITALTDMQRQAYELLLGGGVAKAMDLSQEDRRTLQRYDSEQYVRNGAWNKVSRGRAGMYTSQAKSIGRLLLLARRLCEAGCGFITIHAGYAGVWDMHADGNNLNMVDGMNAVGLSFDHAVAAFIEDIESRGMQDDILLVATGEMGRTPRINSRGGRDHWSRLAPLLLYGAGVPRGAVIGESTRDAGEPATDAYTPSHLIATILNTVLDPGLLRLVPGVPAEVTRLTSASPLPLMV